MFRVRRVCYQELVLSTSSASRKCHYQVAVYRRYASYGKDRIQNYCYVGVAGLLICRKWVVLV